MNNASVLYSLPSLPYGYGDLEPIIDEATLRLHHGKHHQAYVDGTNQALASHPAWQGFAIEDLLARLSELPAEIRESVRKQGGGLANHNLFWRSLSPRGTGSPPVGLALHLNRDFGTFDQFRQQFVTTGLKQFGSGWVFLAADPKNEFALRIMATPNQDSVISDGCVPLLACDVWEHAYYLKYNNRRGDWLQAWWQIVDWVAAEERLNRAREVRCSKVV